MRTVRACFEDHWGHVARLFDEDLESGRHNWNTNPSFDPSLWSLAVAGDEIIGLSLLIGH